jgi:hypothetical protein
MKRALATAVLAVAVLGGCGMDTCTSSPAKLSPTVGSSCTLAAGSSATIQVSLCSSCNDSSPTCQAEFTNGVLEIAPSVEQCQDQSGCASTGCNASVRTATCGVAVPMGLSGQYQMVLIGDGSPVYGTVTIGSGSTCVL